MVENYKIFTELANLQSDYETKTIQIVDGLYYSQFKTVKMCEFYSNSTYLRNNTSRFGDKMLGKNKDGMGRDKPFYNIVNYRVTLAKTATDLDIKDIQITADSEEYWTKAMLLNKEVYKWMKESNFSLALNKMGYARPKYGGYMIKKVLEDKDKKDGKKEELKIDVVEWKNVVTNQVNILGNPIVEHHFMSPVELKKKNGVWKNVIEVLKANKKLKERSPTIDVYEITGEFPKSLYLEAEEKEFTDDDEFTFSLQQYFIADVGGKKYKLYCDEIDESPYMYLPWEEMSGRGLGKGVIEDSEEAQVWTNDAVVNEKRAMDLAGRVGIKTTSKKLGNNILEHDFGKIYELEEGKDINSFNLAPSALGQFQNQIGMWKVQADNTTSSFEAATGEQPPSGTPLGTTQLLNAVATKPFDYRREEWGIHLTEMFEKWIIPFVIKRIYKGHILQAEYSDDELQTIDKSIRAVNGNQLIKENLLASKLTTPEEMEGNRMSVDNQLQKFGKNRFLDVPKGYFDDVEYGITIVTTGEQKNKAATLQSLSTILDTVIKSYNPNTGTFGVLEDPKLAKIFGTIVELSGSGISPITLGLGGSPQRLPPSAPQPAPIPSPIQQSTPLVPQ